MNDISLSRGEAPQFEDLRASALDIHPVQESDGIPLVTQYLRIALRWRWLILGSIAVALLIGIVATLLATPLYTASTRIEISREANRVVNIDDTQPKTSPIDVEFYQTQYGLLKSRSLAERIVRELRLNQNRDFFEKVSGEGSFDAVARGAATAEAARDKRFNAAVGMLLSNVDISPLRGSRLVDIRWTSPNPEISARIANTWASEFIKSNLERRFEATTYARQFLEQRLQQLRIRLEESERQLVRYASEQEIINIPVPGAAPNGGAQERSLAADSLAALNAELSQATADRIRAEARLRQGGQGASAEALQNNAIASLRQRRAEVAADYSRMLAQFEPGYPLAEQLKAQLTELDRSIAREEARIKASIANAYNDSSMREKELTQRVNQLKGSFLDQRRRSIQYNIYQRDADTNRELYEGLLQRYKEIGVAGALGTNNVATVDTAQVPKVPSRPRPLINFLLSLIAGIAVGIGLALIREQIDESITDPSDLEQRLGLPLLGAIPISEGKAPYEELKNPKSSLVEAYLSVQVSLGFATAHGIPRSLSVTSTRPGEGKSTTAYALAFSIARSGAKTVLVDGDMRSPSIHSAVGVLNTVGLSNYLSGTGDIGSILQRTQEPFAIIPAGPQPPNAADLLRSDRLEKMIEDLLNDFDCVIIDCPPVMGLADAPIIASKTEGTVYVIQARGVRARIARAALARLSQARARLFGTVLTKFDAKRAHLGYGYDYGYGYGLGEKGNA